MLMFGIALIIGLFIGGFLGVSLMCILIYSKDKGDFIMKKSIFRNDRVILLKEYENLKQVGKTYEVGGFTNSAVILREVKSKVAVGAIKVNDFDEYFEKIENVGNKFTPWAGISDPNGNLIADYRTNQKKVQIRLFIEDTTQYIKGEASCNKGDEFNLYFGIRLALARAIDKYYKNNLIPEQETSYSNLRKVYKQNKKLMRDLVTSLEKRTED